MILFVAAGIAGGVDFYLWEYDYGHNLSDDAAIKVPGMSYQPPLFGSKQLLNFVANSYPDTGGWAVIGAGLLSLVLFVFELRSGKKLKPETVRSANNINETELSNIDKEQEHKYEMA